MRCGVRWRVGGAALLAALAGCASPRELVRTVDESHAVITRGIRDVVDATDRAFGEPRVEDGERLVRLRLGPSVELRENVGTTWSLPSMSNPLAELVHRYMVMYGFSARMPGSNRALHSASASISEPIPGIPCSRRAVSRRCQKWM